MTTKRRYDRGGKESRGDRSFHACRTHSAFVLHMKYYRRKWSLAVKRREAMNERQRQAEKNRVAIQKARLKRQILTTLYGIDFAKPGSDRSVRISFTSDGIIHTID